LKTIIEKAPQEWKTVKFNEIAKQRSVRVDDPGESGYERYVGLEHLDSGSPIVKRYGSTKDVTSSMKLFKKGDVLFARRNTYLRRCSLATFDGVCSGDIIILQPILDHIVEDFLPVFMQFEPLENRIISLSAGAFSKRIKWKQLAEEEIPLPTKEEQQKIVKTIWNIQDNIQKTKKLIETTETLKQGLLNELLTKGIGHTRFKDTELGRIPEEWEVESLKSITSKITKGTTPTTYGNSFVDEGINFIKVESIDEFGKFLPESFAYIDEDTNLMLSRSILQENDILFSIAGALGRVARVTQNILPANTNQALAIIRITEENILHQYAQYYLSSDITQEYISKHSVKTAQANVSLTLLSKLPIFIPSKNEQLKICAIIKKVEENLNSYILHLEKLKNLKKKLMNKLIIGKVRV